VLAVLRNKNKEMGRACSAYGERTSAYRILVALFEEKSLLGTLRRYWENNIKMDF
jgi:hypothetical protein